MPTPGIASKRSTGLHFPWGLGRARPLGLKWDDVDLDHGQLRVSRALQRVNGDFGLHRLRCCRRASVRGATHIFTTTIGTPLEGAAVTKSRSTMPMSYTLFDRSGSFVVCWQDPFNV
jgi:hypothetical protein